MMFYKRFLRKLAHFQTHHPILTLLLVLAITTALFGGVSKVRTVASLEQMMPKHVEEIKAFNQLRDNYLGQDMIAVVIEVNRQSTDPQGIMDVRDKEAIAYVQHLKGLLVSEPDIREAYAAGDSIIYAANQMGMQAESVDDIPEDIYAQIISSEQLQSQLSNFINEDFSTTIIIATTDVSADDSRMKILAEKIQSHIESAGHPPGLKLKLTGTPVIQQKLGELISRDRTYTQRISTLLVFIITMILFGTFTSALVPIIVVSISVNWLYGVMGYADLPISTLAGGVASMVIGIGIDYSIHLMNKFKNERKEGKSIAAAIETAVEETGTALTGAAIATVLAFLAFLFGQMPEMNRFGLLMAIGVSAAFVLSIFGLPALLIIEEKIIHRMRKRMRFGVEGEYTLYAKDEIHPDSHKEVDIDNLDEKELKTLARRYKICRRTR